MEDVIVNGVRYELIKKIREERLNTRDEHIRLVSDFNCGCVETLNDYIQGDAFQHNSSGEGNTFLFFKNDTDTIIGYCTLRSGSVKVENEYYPVVEISRLAIDARYQRRQLGTMIFFIGITHKIIKASRLIGVRGVLVFADSDAIDFYKHLGFEDIGKECVEVLEDGFRDDCTALILKIDDDFIAAFNNVYNVAKEENFYEIIK